MVALGVVELGVLATYESAVWEELAVWWTFV